VPPHIGCQEEEDLKAEAYEYQGLDLPIIPELLDILQADQEIKSIITHSEILQVIFQSTKVNNV